MAITHISRDCLTETVDLVRIISTDSLAAVSAPGYITAQAANIAAANNGTFNWLSTDEVLINAGGTVVNNVIVGGTNAFFQISPDFSSLVATGLSPASALGLTAHAGGGQANGTPLIPGFNQFTTVATTADSATLPAKVLAQTVIVTNNSANSMNVYPATGDNINALAANTAIAVAAGATTIFYGVTATNWITK